MSLQRSGTAGDVSNVLLWTPAHRHTRVRKPERTYKHLLLWALDAVRRTCWDRWKRERERESRGTLVIVVGNGHGDTSSNHGRSSSYFRIGPMTQQKVFIQLFSLLQVFVELGNLHGTSNYVHYWIHVGRLFWFR